MAMVPYSKELQELLTKKDRFGESYSMYEHAEGQPYMMVPRGLVSPQGQFHDFRSEAPVAQLIARKSPRNADQARCIDESLKLLQAGVDHIAEAPTGFGKTYLGSEVANRLGQRTLVIVTKNDLVKGWKDTFVHLIGCNPKEVGHIQQDVCEFQGCRYVVAMIHSLLCRDYDPLLYRYFGLVIFDECFPAGTLVDGRKIEDFKVGDQVSTVLPTGEVGLSTVTATTKKSGTWFARASHGGCTITSTATQPVYVEALGYIPAALLLKGDYVLRTVSSSGVQPEQENQGEAQEGTACVLQQRSWGVVEVRERGQGKWPEVSRVEPPARFQADDREQSDVAIDCTSQGLQGYDGQTFRQAGWQRHGVDPSAAEIVERFERFISNTGVPDWSPNKLRSWYAQELRNGHCNSKHQAMHRTRWAFSQFFEAAGIRLEKRHVLERSRVDCLEVQERASAIRSGWGIGSGEVFNLEVEGTHNYFAGGILVHNCHRLGADHFIQAAKMFPAKYRLGLSATPERSDGRQQLFQAHIGPVMVKGNWVPMAPKILVKKTGWKVPLVPRRDEHGEWRRVPMEVIPGRSTVVHQAMAKDPARNQEIVEYVRAAYAAGRRTLVLSTLIDDHLKPLFFLLTKAGIPGEDIGYYIGGMSSQQLEASKNKRVVLATFKMTGEGTDVPIWDSLVLAVPLAKVKQAVGRVMRTLEGKAQPVVLDLVDNHPTLQGFYYSRLKEYYSVNADIVEV
jgi:superfamily II DNA or RNA helicase